MIAELGLLRLILSQPNAYSGLRAAWLKLEARWAPRGPTLLGRRVNLLRGLLCAEEGMPLEARARWAAAAAPGGGPRCRLVAVCAQRFHEADGPSARAEARALAAEAPLAATALAAVEVAAVSAPGRARFAALPLWVR